MTKEKLLLVGAGGFGRVASELARQEYDCAFVDDGIEVGSIVCDIPVVGKTSDLKDLFSSYKKLVVTIGNNKIRKDMYSLAMGIGYSFPNLIYEDVYISPCAKIGNGCVFLNRVCIQNGSFVGNGVILNPGVEVHHDSYVDDYSLIYTNSVVRTNAHVGKCVRIGSNCTICNNANVKDGSDIQDCVAVHCEG